MSAIGRLICIYIHISQSIDPEHQHISVVCRATIYSYRSLSDIFINDKA